jgi:hypothetical protein
MMGRAQEYAESVASQFAEFDKTNVSDGLYWHEELDVKELECTVSLDRELLAVKLVCALDWPRCEAVFVGDGTARIKVLWGSDAGEHVVPAPSLESQLWQWIQDAQEGL